MGEHLGRFENGWVRWHRKAFFGDIGTNAHCLSLWVSLLTMANYMPSKIIWNGSQRDVPPGSLIIGIRELAEKLGCSKNTINKWLKYLQSTDRILIDNGPRGTFVTICNWEKYQGEDDVAGTLSDQQLTANWPTPGTTTGQHLGQQVTLTEEDKKERIKKVCAQKFDFETLYKNYPRKMGKSQGIKKALREVKNQEDYHALDQAIEKFRKFHLQKGTEAQFIPHFSTFMSSWRDWCDPDAGKVVVAQPQAYAVIQSKPEEDIPVADPAKVREILAGMGLGRRDAS